MRVLLTTALLLLAPKLGVGQDTTRIKAQTDSIRRETCRGGQLSASGLTCSGAKQSTRVTVIRRLANRVDSLLRVGVAPAPTPVPPVDTVIQPPPSSGAPELPRQYINFGFPTPTRSIAVNAGADLQAALTAAQAGDELVLAAGATWTGNYSVSSCPSAFITLRTSGVLSSSTTRARPSTATAFAKLVTPNNEPALYFRPGSCNWRVVGVEATVAPSVTATVYGIVRLEGTRLSLSQVYLHGQAASQIARCATMNGAYQEIVHSWLSECHGDGYDSQAIHGGLGAGPFRIVDNYLEGAGENVMFGGQDPRVAGLVPSDIEIRRNHFYKPDAWRGTAWDIKNLLELKNAVRVLIEDNVLEGSWPANQDGWAMILVSANQDGTCRWCRVTDVTIRRNWIRRTAQGINIATNSYTVTDTSARRILVAENVVDSIGVHPADAGADRRGFQTLKGTQTVTLTRNLLTGPSVKAAFWVEGGAPLVLTDNAWVPGLYAIIGSGYSGTAALDYYAPGWVLTGQQWLTSEATSPLAQSIRTAVTTATAGVVVPP